MSSIFAGIENAQETWGNNWIRPGEYLLQITSVRQSFNRNKEPRLPIELRVVEVYNDNEGKGHRVGEDIVHMLKVNNDSFLGNFKQFAAAVLGVDAKQITEAEAKKITSDAQPFAGALVRAKAHNVKTKGKGEDFTVVLYERVAQQAA